MERKNLKKGDRVVVNKKFKVLANIPAQTIERIEGQYFWSKHFNGWNIKHLSHILINGKLIELTY